MLTVTNNKHFAGADAAERREIVIKL